MNSDDIFDPHEGEEMPSEGDLMVLQSQASSVLSAFVVDNQKMAAALTANIWGQGCGPRMYSMVTWVGTVIGAAKHVKIRPGFAMGVLDDETGQPRVARPEEMEESHRVAESFMNLLVSTALDASLPDDEREMAGNNALDAMHDYMHEASEEDARHAFVSVMAACGNFLQKVMEEFTTGMLPWQGMADADDDTIRQAFGL